ncbi:disulfide bond formation protein B [Limimaricola hongkongensis]|uniref:Periplasmic thiol:disulfide oxidoreductase DsbB, required for DsbA reoxidation n=1 Tax=Limimaricola hongkongensis DSM 17492 TaxID=1122180 RepID=A0A017HCF3_9RHOB|nr:disulfide bond formation protein B [Limimaricola hongkongensis]EYD71843.1 Periplasmic thiol:disulfide oxidoreductase DsbB, required for DsbA reoxidation [Limimaricola hongkongensis DSM 17492]
MSRKLTLLLATLGSAALLGGAFVFQALGYPPCAMCIWQRWPHGIAIAIGLIALVLPGRALPALGALAAATTAAIGVFHSGVERGWWEGPSSCTGTGQGLGALSGSDLLSTDGPVLVMCDVVSWELVGLSMASWNALLSAGLVLLWVSALRRS